MSFRVANLCAERRFGSPVRKQIIMFLADKASDDGSGIWCSKGSIARHTELGDSTVKRVINEFVRDGVLQEVGQRACANGSTKVYQIVLQAVEALETLAPDGSTGSTADGVPGPQRTPNHPKTILEPSLGGDGREFEEFWKVYPRPRDQDACRVLFGQAVAEGTPSSLIVEAAKRYRREREGLNQHYTCTAPNWLQKKKWEEYPDLVASGGAGLPKQAGLEGTAAMWAGKVRAGSYVPPNALSASIVDCIIANGLLTPAELQRAGVSL